jgi:hypothetical protein
MKVGKFKNQLYFGYFLKFVLQIRGFKSIFLSNFGKYFFSQKSFICVEIIIFKSKNVKFHPKKRTVDLGVY